MRDGAKFTGNKNQIFTGAKYRARGREGIGDEGTRARVCGNVTIVDEG